MELAQVHTGELVPEIVEEGRQAWERIKIGAKMLREDWLKVGEALAVGRKENPSNNAFSEWCKSNGFGDIKSTVRSKAKWLFDNQDAVLNIVQDDITDNHPCHIYTAYRKIEKQKQLEQARAEHQEQSSKDVSENKPVIFHLDCFEFLGEIESESADLLITDPPYSTDIDDIYGFASGWLPVALDKIKDTGRAYICIGAYPKELHAYLDILLKQDRFIVDNPLIWTYRNTLGVTPKYKYNLNYQVILHLYTELSGELDTSITNEMFSVQDINAPDGRQGDRFHSWQKPDELANRLIRHSTTESSVVIDPFACTGAFLISAARHGCFAAGCDIDLDAVEVAYERGCRLG